MRMLGRFLGGGSLGLGQKQPVEVRLKQMS